jgi:Tfp pilus assembly protein PilF
LAYNYFKADESGAEFDDSLSLKGNYENFAQLSSSAKMYVTLKWMEESIPTETIKWNNSELLVQVGRLYYDKGYYEAGIRSFKSALSLKPDDLQAHYMLALTYKKLGDEALFQEEYLQVKQLSPEEAEKLLSEP